jgi:hypothetical protein
MTMVSKKLEYSATLGQSNDASFMDITIANRAYQCHSNINYAPSMYIYLNTMNGLIIPSLNNH